MSSFRPVTGRLSAGWGLWLLPLLAGWFELTGSEACLAATAPAPVAALAARGSLVAAGTIGAGLLLSTDGGLTFGAVPSVQCPAGSVRDVLFYGSAGIYAACGDLRIAWSGNAGGTFTSETTSAEVYGDICPRLDDAGRPHLAVDPQTSGILRTTGLLSCGFISCDAAQTVSSAAIDTYPGCPFSSSQLLAPLSRLSPFLLSTRTGSGGTTVRSSLARALPAAFTYGPGGYFTTLNVETVGLIPDSAIVALGREIGRPERILAGGGGGLYRSLDQGWTWNRVEAIPAGVSALAVDPTAPGRYAVAAGRTVQVSADGGESWRALPPSASTVTALTFDEADVAVLLTGLADGSVSRARLTYPLAEPAGAPTVVSVTRAGNALDVIWTARSAEASSYRVERRSLGAGPWVPVSGALPSSPFRDGAPPLDQPLGYRVVAVGGQGAESASAETFGIVPTTEPLPPDGLTIGPGSDGTLVLSWNDRSTREEGYRIEFRGSSDALRDFEWRPFAVTGPDATSFRFRAGPKGLTDGTYRVVAWNSAGESVPSAPAGRNVSVGYAFLSGSQVTASGTRTVSLSIDATADVTSAAIQRSVAGGPFQELASLSLSGVSSTPANGGHLHRTASYMDAGVPKEVDLAYRVRVFNELSGEAGSAYSNTLVFAGADFALALKPGQVTSSWRDSTTAQVSTSSASSSSDPITLTAKPSDPGITATFNLASVKAGDSASLTLAFVPTLAAGSYSVVIQGSRGAASHEATLLVTVTEAVYLVTAARSGGAGGAFFRTDAMIVLTGSGTPTVTPVFLNQAAGGATIVGTPRTGFYMRSYLITDLLASEFHVSDPAYGPVRFDSDGSVSVTANVFTENACGTVGFSYQGIRERDTLKEGFFPMVSLGGGARRTNLVFLNPSHTTAARILVDSSLRGLEVNLPPGGWSQVNDVRTDLNPAPSLQALTFSSDTPILALATVIDNSSNQAFALSPLPK